MTTAASSAPDARPPWRQQLDSYSLAKGQGAPAGAAPREYEIFGGADDSDADSPERQEIPDTPARGPARAGASGRIRKARENPREPRLERARLHLLKGAEIAQEDVPWILENRIPDKTVFGIHGRPGDGKTRLALLIGAELSRGLTPFTGQRCVPRNVVIMSNEDGPGRIRGLYESMGGDPARLFVENTDDAWWLGDSERLTLAMEESDAGFVVVDSLASHSGKADLNAHADTTRLLVPLRAVAERHGCSVAVVHHLNKLVTPDHIAKVAGSIGITASFRHNLHVIPDPEDANLRLVVNGKTNLAPPNFPALRFALFPCEWRGTSTVTIEQAYSLPTDSEERPGKAVEWLREALADGERHDAGKLQQQAKSGFNLSSRSIFRAAERLNVERQKDGFGGRATWRLPESAITDAPPSDGTHGTHGNDGHLKGLQVENTSCVPSVPLPTGEASPVARMSRSESLEVTTEDAGENIEGEL